MIPNFGWARPCPLSLRRTVGVEQQRHQLGEDRLELLLEPCSACTELLGEQQQVIAPGASFGDTVRATEREGLLKIVFKDARQGVMGGLARRRVSEVDTASEELQHPND